MTASSSPASEERRKFRFRKDLGIVEYPTTLAKNILDFSVDLDRPKMLRGEIESD
jgi:hypothetical protein